MSEITFALVVTPDEEDGGYYATTPTLRGVVGQGETQDEAARDLASAIRFTIESIIEEGEPLPKTDESAESLPLLDEPRSYRTKMVV